jgi:RNA polymerase sigma-70 factor, ECF subfamily
MSVASSELSAQIERDRAALTAYIRSLIRNAAEAEDLAQETFLRAHNRLDTLRDPGALEGWLYQIATHITIDRIRQRSGVAEQQLHKPADELTIPDNRQPSALTVLQQTEMSACVQAHVAKLSDAYKAVLLLHDVDGLTANEIAALLGLPLTNVRGW